LNFEPLIEHFQKQ